MGDGTCVVYFIYFILNARAPWQPHSTHEDEDTHPHTANEHLEVSTQSEEEEKTQKSNGTRCRGREC